MSVSRRTLIAALAGAPASALLSRGALAAYPDRSIRLVVPFAAGGNADNVGRVIGEIISKAVGQTVVVENRGGAGGGIGAEMVARADPDGYTLLVASNGPMTVNPFVQPKIGYDSLKDFAAVALTSYVPHAIIVNNNVKATSVPELVALSKTKAVNLATSGVGSATHMTLERFKAATGANITHVPYKGGATLLPDVLSGAIEGAMMEFSTALPQHKGGKARIVGIAAAKRSALAPEIATFIEAGVKDFTAQSYIGVVAPAKTPPDVIAKLQKAIAEGLAAGPAPEKLRGMGSEIATAEQMTSKGFDAFIRADYESMRQAAKLAGIGPR